jgi:ribose/xylose/arabinose/galactoside ABC-type transport system permease subunit
MIKNTSLSVNDSKGEGLVWKLDLQRTLYKHGTLIFFVLLLLLNAFITPNFVSYGTLRNLLLQVFPIMLVSLGMMLVISSEGIDISVGAIMSISASVTVKLFSLEFGLIPSIMAGLAAGCLCGLFNGVMIARFKIQPIVITLILMIAGRGLAQIILGELSLSFYYTSLADLGSFKLGGLIPVQMIIMLAVILVIGFFVKTTVFARHVEAVGDNCRASKLSGVNIPLIIIGVYVLCGVLSGLAGIMEAARINSINAASLGLMVELDVIAAVAIGGTPFTGGKPRVMGTVLGALIVQLVTIIVNMNNIQFHYSLVIKAIIIVLALYLQKEQA